MVVVVVVGRMMVISSDRYDSSCGSRVDVTVVVIVIVAVTIVTLI